MKKIISFTGALLPESKIVSLSLLEEIILLNCFVQFLKTLTQCVHCAVLFYLTQKLIEMLNTFAPFNGHYKRANKSVFSNLR